MPDKAPIQANKRPIAKARIDRLTQNLAGVYATAGILLSSRDQYDGMVVTISAVKRAEEVALAASHNKRLFEVLERLVQNNDVFNMIIGHGAMLYAILSHHDRIPANPAILQQFGYTEQQLFNAFSQPMEAAAQNGTASSSGFTNAQPGAIPVTS